MRRLPHTELFERFVEQYREPLRRRTRLPRNEIHTERAGLTQYRPGIGRARRRGLRQDRRHPTTHPPLRSLLFRHSVGDIVREPFRPVGQDGRHQRILRAEMPVEGVVGQTGRGDDIGHPRACVRTPAPHLIERRVEEPADFAGVFGLPPGHRPPRDPTYQPRLGKNCILVHKKDILTRREESQMAWDFETEPDFQEKLDWADTFVRDEVEPLDLIWPHHQFVPLEGARRAAIDPLKQRVREQGLWATHLGPDLGGQGYGQLKLALLNEILGRSSWAPIVFGCQAPDTGNAEIIAHYGTEAQKQRYLQPLLDGELFSCYSMTEPHAGADPTLFRTRAERDGDDWVINGRKFFSSNARTASFLIVMAVTDPSVSPYQGMSMFLVPADTPGVEIERNIGLAGEPLGDGSHALIHYRDVRVPADALLGGEGQAFVIAQTRLGGGRIHHAMRTIGLAQKALDMMCERALSRETAGSRLADKQFVQGYIADSYAQLKQFRLLVLHTAWEINKYNDYKKVRKDIAAVKVVMPTVLHDIAWRAMQVHGALGTTNEMPFFTMIHGAGVMGLADGPTEVHKMTVAKQVLRDHRPAGDDWPTEWIPRRLAAARAKYADYLDTEADNL